MLSSLINHFLWLHLFSPNPFSSLHFLYVEMILRLQDVLVFLIRVWHVVVRYGFIHLPAFFAMSWIICVIKYFYIHQVSDFPEDQLLVAVFPGVPTAAELFLLPNKNQSEGKKKSEEELEKVGIICPFRNEWKPIRFRPRCVNVFSLLPNRRPASSWAHWTKTLWSLSWSLASESSSTTLS